MPPKFIFTQSRVVPKTIHFKFFPENPFSPECLGVNCHKYIRARPPALKTSGRKYKERPSLRHNNQFICNLCFFDATPFRRGRPLSLVTGNINGFGFGHSNLYRCGYFHSCVLVILLWIFSNLLLCFGHSTVDIFQSFYRGFCSFFVYLNF